MTALVLHIGAHRTGSTTVQGFLESSAPLLARHGLRYVRVGRPQTPPWPREWQSAHHELAWRTVGARGFSADVEGAWRPVLEEVDRQPDVRHIVSAEDLSAATDDQVRELRRVLGSRAVQVVLYRRDPAAWALSRYKQLVAGRDSFEKFTFGAFLDSAFVDLAAVEERWSAAFGRAAVTVRSFEDAVGGPGLLRSFGDLLGLPSSATEGRDVPSNASAPDRVVQAARLLNHTLGWPIVGSVTRRARAELGSHRRTLTTRIVLAALAPWTLKPIATETEHARLRQLGGARVREVR